MIRHQFEMNRQLGIVEIDMPAFRLFDEAAHFTFNLR